MNGGFVPQTFVSSLPLQADPSLRFKPATRAENECASGSAASYQAIDKLEAGNARIVLVVRNPVASNWKSPAGAKLGGVFNMDGSAVANYVSILEPLRG